MNGAGRIGGKLLHHPAGVVRGGAVHQENLELPGRQGLGAQIPQKKRQGRGGVIGHDDKADRNHGNSNSDALAGAPAQTPL